ncbi:rho GTPase-activating protein conundrum-like isoform X2 [Photinus pyralis]|uniref:rho GTPase-activating protein conundrum-like isoform X2 n=1 Tax=Photinus pyralis TaxID=7054 RepID=UPI001266F9B4|nr:rho GTPase-activating protein conundrum-like isoform X2 [Photinus pyralis]
MESSTEVVGLGSDAIRFYYSEVKNVHQEFEFEDEEHLVLDEAEQATDFLHKADLSSLSKIYQEGKEITDVLVNNTIKQRNLTEKQAQTIKSRVRTLNKTLHSRQPRRKQRQDVRDVAWSNVETSSTGTRSRSATPDSLDSVGAINEDLTSDEDQPLSLPSYPLDLNNMALKGKLKWTTSEPLHNKFSRQDRGDVAHLGSENVILKGYQPIKEHGTIRERSGSDPSTDTINTIDILHPDVFRKDSITLSNKLSRSHNSLLIPTSDDEKAYKRNKDRISFEGILKQNENIHLHQSSLDFDKSAKICIDDLSDSQYQHLTPLLWVEVTSIFDHYKIPIVKRKANIKSRRGNVFGVNLSSLIMRDMPRPNDTSMVPQIFQSILFQLNTRCLQEDGILRIASHQQKLNYLTNEIEGKFYNNRKHVEHILNEATVHDLTGILKKLLRDLPDTVFTMELFDMFYKCSLIPAREEQKKALNLLVLLLPVEHRNTLRLLLQFCINVISHEADNRMNLHNVAMITAPSFFSPRLLLPKENGKLNLKSLSKEELVKQINGAAVSCSIVEQMLKAGDNLWMVPADLAEQAKESQKRAQDRKDPGKEKRLSFCCCCLRFIL